MSVPGKVWLVGAGPGAADLLTLRAARLLAEAEVVFHDALVDPAVLALAPQARCVAVGKRACRPSTAQRFINKQLVDAARSHGTVVRLKGGDPMLFGRAEEEIAALEAAGIAWDVVPGVTAASAAAAALGRSLTRRGTARSVSFVTPTVGEGEAPNQAWMEAARAADTVAVYMGARQLAAFAAALVASGKPAATPLATVANASLPQQRIWHGTLASAAEADTDSAAAVLVLIGPPAQARPEQATERPAHQAMESAA